MPDQFKVNVGYQRNQDQTIMVFRIFVDFYVLYLPNTYKSRSGAV